MQLAAATHPARAPPVPPRPSRQIVAEALKKSPRPQPPPCPTRQAPAPPKNQRPWQHNHVPESGRTVVYDSSSSSSNGDKSPIDEQSQDSPAKKVNNKYNEKKDNKQKIDDTSKRKDKPDLVNGNDKDDNNNKDAEQDKDKDQCDGLTTKDETKSKKKPQIVKFKEQEKESKKNISELNAKTTVENGATVVVIEDASSNPTQEPDNIQRQDWLEAGVRYSSTKITLPAPETATKINGSNSTEFADLDFSRIIERIAMSSLQGLPPLPRSLSGFNLNGAGLEPPPPPPPARSASRTGQYGGRLVKTPSSTSSQGSRPSPQGRQLTTLDTQLAILRREMFGLRQLDLSLLSQLWSLNESIQEFRQLLQDQEDRAPSPSPSSEDGDDSQLQQIYSHQPPPPPRRPAPSVPYHNHHHPHHHPPHHHYRSARSRNSTSSSHLPPSDDSPSSEEYGAV